MPFLPRLFAGMRAGVRRETRPDAASTPGALPDRGQIGWVVSGEHPEATSSYRYTAYIPARELGGPVLRFEQGMDAEALLDQNALRGLVLGKAFDDSFVSLARAGKARGIPVLAAMCDWHFDSPVNRKLSRIADRVVVQTEMMAAGVRQHFSVEPVIIEEPYEGPRGEPRFAPGETIRLLWYGHDANLDTLAAGVMQVANLAGLKLEISVVTNRPQDVPLALARLEGSKANLRIISHAWSPQRQWQELAACDAVLLPSLPTRDKLVKGHGRLVQAIHAGRLALAYPLPQYEELSQFCWCDEQLGEGLAWALSHPSEALQRIIAGQTCIDTRFAPSRIARRWLEEIERNSGAPGARTR
ncbi:MAG: glycosyltransferase family 1 protein [Betaproteobacteria bacterium]|nr:glycosyltransferase family 1 protein [Betaproteobacteria bacterium]